MSSKRKPPAVALQSTLVRQLEKKLARIEERFADCEQQGRSAFEYLVSVIAAHFSHQEIPSLAIAETNSS